MKNLLPKLLIVSLLLGVTWLSNPHQAFAAANFYLSPASKTVSQGSSFAVAVRVSSAEAIDSVQANLSYPADKLDFLSISTSSSAFSLQWENSGGGGSVRIARSVPGGSVSGDKLIATVSFRAKQSSGSATISFAGGTEAVSAGTSVGGGKTGGTYTFSPAPPPPPPPPPPDTTAPKITDVKVTATTFKGATIEWKTDEDSSSAVEYGLNNKYGLTAQSEGLTKAHKVAFSSEFLIPGETYHFKVKSADAAGNLATSTDSTFKAHGFTVKIKVVNEKGKPVEGAKVTLSSEPLTRVTDKDGVATFENVAPGKHLVNVEFGGKLQSSTIEVKDATEEELKTGKLATQSSQVKVTAGAFLAPNQILWPLLVGLATLITILLAGGFVWWKKRKSNHNK
ncbi:MAG: hypothetical protein A2Z24_00445 [Candidatus Woykebacteria bacterium RBG_16_44_10]|uniref:Big-1 domain-containing protein n=1 Tax=Candidatus Woykebacteria bacterium RBG_16_44_10 TaxID=1802597 RepID=A0A1G1WEY0_9BACT|nr:MAG: hypothetical protein A2Z24_00445 [Candidatus Woykebacteria bacterium RBG_16_44_10]